MLFQVDHHEAPVLDEITIIVRFAKNWMQLALIG
jgi:hypothetical protein